MTTTTSKTQKRYEAAARRAATPCPRCGVCHERPAREGPARLDGFTNLTRLCEVERLALENRRLANDR